MHLRGDLTFATHSIRPQPNVLLHLQSWGCASEKATGSETLSVGAQEDATLKSRSWDCAEGVTVRDGDKPWLFLQPNAMICFLAKAW